MIRTRKFYQIFLIVFLCLIMSGCSLIATTQTTTEILATTAAATPTPTPIPTPSPSPTPTPIPTPTPTPSPEQIEDVRLKTYMALAPDLAGSVKVIKEINGLKRVTYEATATNPYAVAVGTYIGEFYKNVELEGQEVGGVVLIPTVVEKLLRDGLNKIPDGQDKWMVFVPADISNIKNDINIIMEIIDSNPKSNSPDSGLKVSFGGEKVSISNPVLESKTIGVLNAIFSKLFPNMPRAIGPGVSATNDINQNGLMVAGNFNFLEETNDQNRLPFGQSMTEINEPICIYVVSMIAAGKIDNSRVLMVNKSPVFVKGN